MHNFCNKTAKYSIIPTLLLGAFLYPNIIIIIDDDLIEVSYTLEKMCILYMHMVYIAHFTVINLLFCK